MGCCESSENGGGCDCNRGGCMVWSVIIVGGVLSAIAGLGSAVLHFV